MSKQSAKLGRAALAIGLALLVLLTAEWIAGRLDPQHSFRSLHAPKPDAPWLYELNPGAVAVGALGNVEYRIAAHGFRDRDRRREKEEGVYRIAVLGDSVAFGYGVAVEDGFVARLEALLGESKRVEVLNFAVSGFNPYNEAELFRGVVRDFEPDLTLVQFCVNDLNDPRFHFGASTVQRLGDLPVEAFPNAERARDVPWEVSPLAAACDRSNLCRALLGNLLGPARDPEDGADFREAFEVRAGPGFSTEFEWLRARYRDIAGAAADVGSDFGVIVFPAASEIAADPDAVSAGARISSMGDEEGWEVVDLLPAYRATAQDVQTLFIDVWHPTALGHEVAAEEIARSLRARGLGPAPQDGAR